MGMYIKILCGYKIVCQLVIRKCRLVQKGGGKMVRKLQIFNTIHRFHVHSNYHTNSMSTADI